jgi:Tol biopolymer transport system component
MAQPFDAAKGALMGAAAPIVDRVFYNSLAFNAGYSVSATGVLSYRTGVQPPSEIAILDRTGKVLDHVVQPGDYRDIDVSPDGAKLIVHKHEDPSGGGLWLIDWARNTMSRFTFDASHNTDAHWSPDGRVAFMSNRDGAFSSIYQKIASGAGADELVFKADATVNLSDWSPDGKFLVFEKYDPKLLSDIWVWSFADRKATLFLQTPASEGQGRLSPDGKWMVYTSNETGRNEVYVQPFPPSGGKWQVSSSGGSEPRWRGDGRELFFLNAQGATYSMMSVDAQVTGAEFHPGIPKPLFTMRMVNSQGMPRVIAPNTISQLYAVRRDGQRFFALVAQADIEPISITVLTNWTTLLKK